MVGPGWTMSRRCPTSLGVNTPFILPNGAFGLRIEDLRGKHAPCLPSPSEVGWPRALPGRVMTEAVAVVLCRGNTELALGSARFVRTGNLAEGFRVLFRLEQPMPVDLWKSLSVEAAAPPPPDPLELIAALHDGSTTTERMNALSIFLERWFGISGPPSEARIQGPAPLRLLHGLLGDRKASIFDHNHLPDPEVAHDKLVFYVENQGCCTWATEASGEDPPVYARIEDSWALEHSSLSGFLIQMLIFEAVLFAPHSAEHPSLSLRALGRLQRRLPLLPLAEWPVSGVQFFGSRGVLGIAVRGGIGFETAGPNERAVRLGAVDHVCFEPLEAMIRSWPEIGF